MWIEIVICCLTAYWLAVDILLYGTFVVHLLNKLISEVLKVSTSCEEAAQGRPLWQETTSRWRWVAIACAAKEREEHTRSEVDECSSRRR